MQSYVIHLIRNAPSEGNLQGRYIGRTQSPIADEGIKRILDIKREYRYPEVQGFYASPSTRCVDTLSLIYPQAQPEVIFEMEECDFGEFENRTAAELEGNPEFTRWTESGGRIAPPGGESPAEFTGRVCAGFEILVRNMIHMKQTSSALVTYGGVIMTILSAYGLPKAEFYEWMCEPGCGYSIRIMPSLWMRSHAVEVFGTLPLDKGENR